MMKTTTYCPVKGLLGGMAMAAALWAGLYGLIVLGAMLVE